MPLKAHTLKHAELFCSAMKQKLRDRSVSFGPDYLRLLVDKIRVTGKEVLIRGGYKAIGTMVANKKEGTFPRVPNFGIDWLPGTDSNPAASGINSHPLMIHQLS